MKVYYEVKPLKLTDDKLYVSAIKIYAATTPVSIKTSTNEIAQYVENPIKDPERKMFFYALLCNAKVIGFAELGYLYATKVLFIDYLSLDSNEKTNSNFYPFLNLLIDSVNKDNCEINYVVTEISNRNNGRDVDNESKFFKKLVAFEDFYIIDEPYIHPKLGDNTESEFDCNLYIKIVGGENTLNRNTYMAMVHDIYFSHYLNWYSISESKKMTSEYTQYIIDLYKQISEKTDDREVIRMTNNQLLTCDYYGKNNCVYNNSTAGSGSVAKKDQKQKWWIPITISLTCFIITTGIYLALSMLNIHYEIFIPLLAALAVLSSSAISYFAKK